jgi:hypothetical protein
MEPDLADLTDSFLRAEGYEVSARGKDLLVGSRRSIGEDVQFLYVWVPRIQPHASFRSQEGPYLARFKEVGDVHAFAQKFMLVPTFEGLSTEFRKTALQLHNVKVRVPVQFFDTAFRWETTPEASSAAKDLRARGDALMTSRIRQPFVDGDGRNSGPDLLDHLVHALSSPAAAGRVQIIVGPAGIGKSYLFEALFAKLHSGFLESKRKQLLSARPLALLPQFMPLADAPSVRAVLRAYLQTDFARPLDAKVFEWMLGRGLGMWLLDGLDELINQDPDFFDYLLDLLTQPGSSSPPRIVICVRDALLATNGLLRDFCEDYGEFVSIFRLQPWTEAAVRLYVRREIGDEAAASFMARLQTHGSMAKLATIPYYCGLLVEQYRAGGLREDESETVLVQEALASLLAREYDKQLIDELYIHRSDLVELIEALAAEDYESGFQGVPVDEVVQLAEVILPGQDLSEAQLKALTGQLTQLALFTDGGFGRIRFSQEILEQYLLGQWLWRLYRQGADSLLRGLSVRPIPPDWIVLSVLAHFIRSNRADTSLVPIVLQSSPSDAAFRNALQLAALVRDGASLPDVSLARRDLTGVILHGLDLTGRSFRGAVLTEVVFDDCTLRGCNFEEAVLRSTEFRNLGTDALRNAELGPLSRFYSIKVDGRIMSDHAEARKWFEKRTGKTLPASDPCPVALQVRHLFAKFVEPDGSPRRFRLDRKGALAGRRYFNPEPVLDACLQYGLLVFEEFRGRIQRPSDSNYADVVTFITDQKMSPSIRSMVSELCRRPGCNHGLA